MLAADFRSFAPSFVLSFALSIAVTGAACAAEPEGSEARPTAPAAEVPGLHFDPFQDRPFIEARRSGAPVVLYFEADWCTPCKQMHAETFRAPAVLEAAAGSRLFRVDMTSLTAEVELLQKSFRVAGAPTVIVFGPDGQERERRSGFIPPDAFARMLGDSRKPPPST